jgi:hypothetical protein
MSFCVAMLMNANTIFYKVNFFKYPRGLVYKAVCDNVRR